jgi:hypothetical protein
LIEAIASSEESGGTFSPRKASQITYNRQHEARFDSSGVCWGPVLVSPACCDCVCICSVHPNPYRDLPTKKGTNKGSERRGLSRCEPSRRSGAISGDQWRAFFWVELNRKAGCNGWQDFITRRWLS